MNKVILVGRLGADPELKEVGMNKVCTLSLATSKRFKNRDGQKQEKVEWHRCKAWNTQADIIHKYTNKGSHLLIEGEIETRSWEDQSGVKRYATEIKINNFEFLSSSSNQIEEDDEIPF